MDIKNKEERSKNMAAIRSKNTKPELFFRKLLFAQGYRYRMNSKNIQGHPDIYLKKYNTAIFIHGCFWHRHNECKYAYMPKSRIEFWTEKFEANKKRDFVVQSKLHEKGIKCLVVWECTIKHMEKDEEFCKRILEYTTAFLKSQTAFLEI